MTTENKETNAFFQSLCDNRHCFEALENHYDKFASTYNVIVTSGVKINQDAAKALAEQIQKKEEAVILDIPCGTGITGKCLLENGFQIIDGVDLSQKMLDEARSTNYFRNLTKDCLSENGLVSCEASSYDAVICIQGIGVDHILLKHALKEFERVLKPGGVAVYTVNETVNIGELLDLHKTYFVEKKLGLVSITKRYYFTRFGRDEDCYLCVVRKK